jgi:primosomal protein N' (replication factor Y) (superfamily II helicase)
LFFGNSPFGALIFFTFATSAKSPMQPLFADIVLPVPIPQLFTYEVPPSMAERLAVGMRVVVPFGRKKLYSGIVCKLHAQKPDGYEVKPIDTLLDVDPIVNDLQLRFWAWLSEYYQCAPGDVYKAALPAGLKLESETHVFYNTAYDGETELNERDIKVVEFVKGKKACTILEIQTATDINNLLPIINKLIDAGLVFVNEHLRDSYKPKTVNVLALHPQVRSEDALREQFGQLERAPKQLELLMQFLSMAGYAAALTGKTIERSALLSKFEGADGALASLIKRGALLQIECEVDRLDLSARDVAIPNALSAAQQQAMNQIKEHHQQKDTVLLHGVTSSGKTEIYIHLIEEQLQKGNQVLYLLPEIALTTQITTRLKRHFGNKLGIYHSKYSDAERVEVWENLRQHANYQVILGVRSSIFLPFSHLGLVIIDEEHESSFKQYDPAPRYHARDAALVLAHFHGAKVLLGTATPSIESYYNAQTGKFGLVELFERHQNIMMPEIVIANTLEARRKKQMKSHFSPLLMEHIEKALGSGEQVILFQNRRGFSPYVECKECANIPKCKYCDVSMTYHKHINQLTCHYCGYNYILPQTCAACGAPALETRGFGTEKIEEELKLMLPDARLARMDLDTTRSKKAHENLIGEFEKGNIDILIGTQMVTKGLDFEKVSLVGILDADSMLNFPDFRAHERAFQLMAQVSGRAGRKHKQGLVVLQTNNPEHQVVKQVIDNDYKGLYDNQFSERQHFKYPPFYRLIELTVKHKDANKTDRAAKNLALGLRHLFGDRVLGPHAPLIGRIQNLYIREIMLKIERNASPQKAKEMVQAAIHSLIAQPEYRSVAVTIDVDPM